MPAGSFNSQPLEGGCRSSLNSVASTALFQLTAARRRLPTPHHVRCAFLCFNSQPLEGGCVFFAVPHIVGFVSTHSRSKAAARTVLCSRGQTAFQLTAARRRLPRHGMGWPARSIRFNSQPLEGGCKRCPLRLRSEARFQLTAARRRLRNTRVFAPKHAGVSTHSRSKAAACPDTSCTTASLPFQLTAARRRLQDSRDNYITRSLFQLTAARRRLRHSSCSRRIKVRFVSTHSRSKAAARDRKHRGHHARCFNSQPLEGGCTMK